MGFRSKLHKIGHDLKDRRKRENIRKIIKSRSKELIANIRRMERKLKDPRTRKKAQLEIDRLKLKLRHFKMDYQRAEKKTIRYTEKYPKRALAIAAAIGVLVGTIFSSIGFRKK